MITSVCYYYGRQLFHFHCNIHTERQTEKEVVRLMLLALMLAHHKRNYMAIKGLMQKKGVAT